MSNLKTEIDQLSEVDLFIKRAEKNFSLIYGEVKSREYSEKIKNALSEVDPSLQEYFNSEIPKYLFKLSQNVENLSSDTLERITKNIMIFPRAISNVDGKTKDEINQIIVRRSKNKLFNVVDLFNAFLEAAKEGNELESCDNLDDILLHLLGEEETRVRFTDVEAFLKRAEKKYALIVGQDMIEMLMEELLEAISQIPEQHREYLGSDLAKFLFKSG